ncbi:gliadoralin-A-like [Arvicanthis niloticus]|uniref:gliadoralin-A-like n=1 Tax=Arvicanthis niloticus TaxID=61156 RepID=UPI0014875590|nr:gliadoralin-A-like [Arvicanthis niloticus]
MLVVLLTLVMLTLSSAQDSNREFIVSNQRERLPSFQGRPVRTQNPEYQIQQEQQEQQVQQSLQLEQQETQDLQQKKQPPQRPPAQRAQRPLREQLQRRN